MTSAQASLAEPTSIQRVVVGTLGHIDHGKTALVKALTGVDCDRWSEEKERGITIDIGFAHLHDEDLQVGFIDVPGHERFLHNALAGLGGIRVALLVVAATEGVMLQTREHLAIASLLEIPSLVVALTKIDLVSEDLAELAELELHELLEETPYAGAPLLRVSGVTGEGVAELRRELLARGAEHAVEERPNEPVRFPIDRAFQLRGLGSVVTGTLVSGTVQTGDELEVLPSSERVRIRNVQVHGENRPRAHAGERTSLQVGGVELEQLERGLQFLTPGSFRTTDRLCLRYSHLAEAPVELDEPLDVRLHLFSSEVVGTMIPLRPRPLEPGETGIVEVRLKQPVVAVRNDRVILRRLSPATTLGGGRVLDPFWRRPRSPEISNAVERLGNDLEAAVLQWIGSSGPSGLTTADLTTRVDRSTAEVESLLERLAREGCLLKVLGSRAVHWVSSAVFDALTERAVETLRGYFVDHRLHTGMPKAQLVNRLLPGVSVHLSDHYLSLLERSGELRIENDLILLPDRRIELSEAEARAVEEILDHLERGGLSPPATDELRELVPAADRRTFDTATEYLAGQGKIVNLPNQAWVATSAIQEAQQAILEARVDKLTVQEFKSRFDLTRKWAIPLLEHLDSIGFTRRAGDVRLVVRPR